MPVPADVAFAWHERPGAFERLAPPWQRVREIERRGTIRDGDRAVIELHHGLLRRRWVAVHHSYEQNRQFADRQESGPFASWEHVHRFVPTTGETSTLEDEITYRLPFGLFGSLLGRRYAERTLARTFAYRDRRLADDLRRHTDAKAPLRVAITGSTGLIGRSLAAFLRTGGHDVITVSRRPQPGGIVWDPGAGLLEAEALAGVDAVVHLAGEPIGRRWTQARKREIVESRVRGTELLAKTLASLEHRPSVLVSASAIGFYGDRGDEPLDEASERGSGFLAGVCDAWEAACAPAHDAGIRVVNLRIGVVLEAVLPRLLPVFRAGVGGRVGSGRQWWSWISLDDLTAAVLHAITTDGLDGPVNAVAPEACTNADAMRTLARVLRRPCVAPLPAAAARMAFGELAREVLLAGQHVLPTRLETSGFRFAYPRLEAALRHTLGR
ncbi:MAG: TIGR01777 family protein [Actinobacteria bacterium]|nr:TIGR01777 family protein [Actinomycetota bacterium]